MTADAAARKTALDPTRSFIVQAPAGSGKTELLTQRFLGLLACVDLPEQIVAITFTRKAAAEMRQRIVATLRAASEQDGDVPAHRLATLELARNALRRAEQLGWALPEQSQRLRILTIDALNANLAAQFPVLANAAAGAEVTDDAQAWYRLAARRATDGLAEPGELGAGLRSLLAAAGNSLAELERWLAQILPQRDQWLRLLRDNAGVSLADTIEAALGRLGAALEDSMRAETGLELERRMAAILSRRERYLAAAAADTAPERGDASEAGESAAPSTPAAQAVWRTAAELLLTGAGEWRRRFTRREGIPAEDRDLQAQLLAVLGELKARPGLRELLIRLAALPRRPLSAAQRELLLALDSVLPRLLAELRVVFAEQQTVDHTELALTALQALGMADDPTDLLLALDRRIEHILVDEFQDTSRSQWELLERLTAGWQSGDGRSLFLVGDPMQSIYRFRDADRSLFLKAKDQGIGEIRLEPIRLASNFRSAAQIVDWVNASFAPIFAPPTSGPARQPPFHGALAAQAATPGAGVELHELGGGPHADEVLRVVDIVRQEQDRGAGRSIAILVRSRTHLRGMRSALAAAGLPAHAVEIDSLTDTQLGLDLLALTQAMLQDSDRLSWLALLRSPGVGLGWSDLLRLCEGGRDLAVWTLLADRERLSRLSAEARKRVDWFRERISAARKLRAHRPLGRWIRDCWLLLDGPASLTQESELALTERYFQDLDRLALAADVDDPASLREWFSRPAGSEIPDESGIEIMTIHRAKGLEFDVVILPGLGRITRGKYDRLLINNNIILPDGRPIGLVASPGPDPDGLLALLRTIDREEEAAERGRLLYVAATRARQRLHLIGSVNRQSGRAQSGSLLQTLAAGAAWPAARSPERPTGTDMSDDGAELVELPLMSDDGTELVELPLRRLQFDPAMPWPAIAADGLGISTTPNPEFEWVHPASVQVGTLIHRELQYWAERAARAGRLEPPAVALDRYRRALTLLGVEAEDLSEAAARVAEALESVWQDPVGRWILEPRAEAWSELRLALHRDDAIEHLQLDRSFIDQTGEHWIIDYKTGRHLGADVEAFLESEVERYRPQLAAYARAVATIDSRPIRVGLYFPLMARLKSWTPDVAVPPDSAVPASEPESGS